MKKQISILATLMILAGSVAQGQITIRNWQFNTPGDTEDWTNDATSSGFVIADAVGGSGESVLTAVSLIQNDVRAFFPNTSITLPEEATGWDALTIRIRQIGTDGVTPVTFSTAHTNFAMLGSTGGGSTPWPVLFWDTAGGSVTVDQVTESNGWNVFTFDLSAYTTGTIKAGERMDPLTGTGFAGNFEIDYVTITGVSAAVPEVGTVAGIMGAFALSVCFYRRLKG